MDAVVVTAGNTYEVTYDRNCVTTVFVTAPVVDDAGNVPVPVPFAVTANEPLLVASDHEFGYALAGDPDVALADHSVAHDLEVSITAGGFRRRDLVLTVPANPQFPVAGPTALLRRYPVALRGRVFALQTGNPIGGATIELVGPALPVPQQAVLLASPLANALSPAATIQGRALVPVGSPVPIKTARAAAVPGDTFVMLDDRQGLATGQILRFGPVERAHFAEIALVPPTPPNLTLPGPVQLTAPLARSVRLSDAVTPFALGGNVGPTCNLVGETFAGEGIIIVDAQPQGGILRLFDPPNPPAYHAQGAVTGADGTYFIAGIVRFQRPVFRAAAAGFTAQTRTLPIQWTQPTSNLEWRLTP